MKRFLGISLALVAALVMALPAQALDYATFPNLLLTANSPEMKYRGVMWFTSIGGSKGLGISTTTLGAIQTYTDSMTIRLNSRNYTATSGDMIGFQVKPNATAAGTGSVYGGQIQPRFASGVNGATLVGLNIEPILKGSTGTLSGDVRGLEIALTDENVAGKTVSGATSAISIRQQLAAHTFTGGVHAITIGANEGAKAWDSILNLTASSVVVAPGNTTAIGAAGYIKIKIGGTAYRIPVMEDE